MTHTRSTLALATAMLLATTMLSAPARADYKKVGEFGTSDGGAKIVYYDDDTDSSMIITISGEGVITEVWSDDSNPDEQATGAGSHSDKPDVIGLLKSGKAGYTVRIAPADSSQLMGIVGRNGSGLGPHYNPGEQGDDKGPGAAPSHSMSVSKTQEEIKIEIQTMNAVARQLQSIATAMGEGDEGGSESPNSPNGHGSHGNGVDTSGNYTEGQNKTVGDTEKALLGAKPEVVNPPHLNSGATQASPSMTGAGVVRGSNGSSHAPTNGGAPAHRYRGRHT